MPDQKGDGGNFKGDGGNFRPLGGSGLRVSPVALGLWPIAGVTSLGVEDRESVATILAARGCGINHFDTAYSYGAGGRSDRVLREALGGDYSGVVIASKVGMYYDEAGERKLDARPETLKRHCGEILERLGVDRIDLLYLHSPDGVTSIERSAEALADLQREGKVWHVGVSNVDAEGLRRFASVARPAAVQLPLNMLQRETYEAIGPAMQELGVSYVAYWALMKGLLAGGMRRDHRFEPSDRRLSYDIYQGTAWQRAHDLIDRLRAISQRLGCSVAAAVVAWTAAQPGVASVLCGAKRPGQIAETAAAFAMPAAQRAELVAAIAAALAEHAAEDTTA